MRRLELVGKRFGQLTVTALEEVRNQNTVWRCRCDCGRDHVARARVLMSGKTKTCGCSRGEPHGLTGTRIFHCWRNMVARCANPKVREYRHYGGRGVEVCERWKASLLAFISDVGMPPTDRHEIDRINVNGNYEPGNCRWATRRQNMNNMRRNVRVEYAGIEYTIADLAREFGLGYAFLYQRLKKGWTVSAAVHMPSIPRKARAAFRLAEGSRAKR